MTAAEPRGLKVGLFTSGIESGHPSFTAYTASLGEAVQRLRPDVAWTSVGPAATVPGPLAQWPRVRVPRNLHRPLSLTDSLWTTQAIRRLPLDLLHDPTGSMLFARRPNCRSVLTIHDLSSLTMPEVNRRGWLAHRLFGRRACRHADRIIAISEHTKRDLLHHHRVSEEKIRVVPNGLSARFQPPTAGDVARVRERWTGGRPFLLFVGVLQPRKNVPALLRAYAAAREQGLAWPLVVAGGKGWGYEPIFAFVEELKLHDAVVFTGRVDDAELPALYGAAEIFAFPSLYEGFGWPPLEAMACGTPVICSNASSLPEVVGDAALSVDPRDEPAWTQAMLRLAGDADLRHSLREAGRRRAAQFSWERCARETWAVYQEALA